MASSSCAHVPFHPDLGLLSTWMKLLTQLLALIVIIRKLFN